MAFRLESVPKGTTLFKPLYIKKKKIDLALSRKNCAVQEQLKKQNAKSPPVTPCAAQFFLRPGEI